MPSPEDHLRQAWHNESVAPLVEEEAPDWAITVLFYAALHHVRAYLSSLGHTEIEDHGQVFQILNDHTQLPSATIGKYRKFYRMSRKARYDCLTPSSWRTDVDTAKRLLTELRAEIPYGPPPG